MREGARGIKTLVTGESRLGSRELSLAIGRGAQIVPLGIAPYSEAGVLWFVEGEVAAAILLPAGFGLLGAELLFFTPTGGAEVGRGNAETDEIFLDRIGAALAESEVVFGRTAVVAVAFDGHVRVGIGLEERSGLLKSLAGVGANVGFIQIEEGVAHFLGEEFVHALGARRRGGRRVDGDAHGGIGVAARRTGGEGVARRFRGVHGRGTLGRNSADFGRDRDVRGVGSGPRKLDGFTLIDGSTVGRKGSGGLHSSGRRGVRRGGCGRWFLFAPSDEDCKERQRDKKPANSRAERLNHECPPRH